MLSTENQFEAAPGLLADSGRLLSSLSELELGALASLSDESALTIAWFTFDVELSEDVLGRLEKYADLHTFFREQAILAANIKSLNLPHDIIPASLHPADHIA